MREILFRGKDSITKSWVYGALVQQQDDPLKEKAFIISYSNYQFGDFSEAVMHEVDPETVGQCTGFGDKNGNKIFEGDIVCMDDWIPPCMQVAYAKGAFYLAEIENPVKYYGDIYYLTYGGKPCAKVIGNIYDDLSD